MATSFGISPESMNALRGTTIMRQGPAYSSAKAIFSNDGFMELTHAHTVVDAGIQRSREVSLRVNLQAGTLAGTETDRLHSKNAPIKACRTLMSTSSLNSHLFDNIKVYLQRLRLRRQTFAFVASNIVDGTNKTAPTRTKSWRGFQ